MSSELRQLMEQTNEIFIRQVKEWGEILSGFETSNKYKVLNSKGEQVAFLAERGGGIWKFLMRQVFRSHRNLEISVFSNTNQEILSLHRPFYWFFSDMFINEGPNRNIGLVRSRFALLSHTFELIDERGKVFGFVKAPRLRFWNWKFTIYDASENEVGVISKNWGGLLREMFTDADQFGVQLPAWSWEQRAILFASAVTIDLDFFENKKRD
jgi:uncharacterized protein YxjI